MASYCRDLINSSEKILEFSLLNPENCNPRPSDSWLSAARDLTRDYMFSAKMTASSAKSRSVNLSSPNDAPRSPKPTVQPINHSIQTLNREGTRTQPCLNPVSTGKNSNVSLPHMTALSVPVECLYQLKNLLGTSNAFNIFFNYLYLIF